MIEGMIFDIQHFCVDDGPGIRTTVFFKGCPLRCIWCHNAEGLHRASQLSFASDKCTFCEGCLSLCPANCHQFDNHIHTIHFSQCIQCGKCAAFCPNEAVSLIGKRMSAEQVLEEILRDKPFYETSGGGVTLSGGEPLMQPEFAFNIAELAKANGLHVCMETSGYGKEDDLCRLAKVVDLFLFDFKHSSPVEHKRYTGVDNVRILHNLRLLHKMNIPVILRCPIIPNCNDTEAHYNTIAALANEMPNIQEIHLEPYHPFGVNKYAALGMSASYTSKEMMPRSNAEIAANIIRSLTDTFVVIS